MMTNTTNALPPELIDKLGMIPDSTFADLVKALRLTGRLVATLDREETRVFTFFREHGHKYGVSASVDGEAGSAEAVVVVTITPEERDQ